MSVPQLTTLFPPSRYQQLDDNSSAWRFRKMGVDTPQSNYDTVSKCTKTKQHKNTKEQDMENNQHTNFVVLFHLVCNNILKTITSTMKRCNCGRQKIYMRSDRSYILKNVVLHELHVHSWSEHNVGCFLKLALCCF